MGIVIFDDAVLDTMVSMVSFHILYWMVRVLSATLSSTYAALSDPDKAYWGACGCSTVNGIFFPILCYKAAMNGEFWNEWNFFQVRLPSNRTKTALCVSLYVNVTASL